MNDCYLLMDMGLPGLTKDQMIEVDRILVEEYAIPVELMMENAGLNFARLALLYSDRNKKYTIIAGAGNNGGGGIVAARRLAAWGHSVTVYVPKGIDALRRLPNLQLQRAHNLSIPIIEGMPDEAVTSDTFVLDSYIGYSYVRRDNPLTRSVFNILRSANKLVALDTPSGLDLDSGNSDSGITPLATLSIAFVKKGLLTTNQETTGELYVCDIGVPSEIYISRLGIEWTSPFTVSTLQSLSSAFGKDPIQPVRISVESNGRKHWTVSSMS